MKRFILIAVLLGSGTCVAMRKEEPREIQSPHDQGEMVRKGLSDAGLYGKGRESFSERSVTCTVGFGCVLGLFDWLKVAPLKLVANCVSQKKEKVKTE